MRAILLSSNNFTSFPDSILNEVDNIITNLYLDNNILFHDYHIITDQFEYDFFDNTFISDICVLNKESNLPGFVKFNYIKLSNISHKVLKIKNY